MSDPTQVLPTHERRRLLAVVTGEPPHKVYDGMRLTDRQSKRYRALAVRRLDGEPLQYLEGTVPFGPLELAVDRRALIPRPETERLWERVTELVAERAEPSVIVDLCTGSGCLALALKHSFLGAHVVATDLSEEALSLAKANGRSTRLVVEFREGDLYDALPDDLVGRVDVLVANPPYVEDGAFLPMEIREHEPPMALFAGPDGLEVIRRLADGLDRWLSPQGFAAFEIGEGQGDEVTSLCTAAGFDAVVEADLAGRPRYVIATR